jgi:hypothetical protein
MEVVYWIQIADLTTSSALELDQAAYLALQQARQALIDLNAFEQKYEILLNNYRDFELHCAHQSLMSVLSSDYSYQTANVVLAEANRMFMNFLTAHHSYVDQVVQDFKQLALGDALKPAGIIASVSFKEIAETKLRDTYDASGDYRAICALRNHAQHSSPPIHGVKGARKTCWAESLIFYSQKSVLAQNKKFKSSVMHEIAEQLDIRLTCKRAMERISRAHVELRQIVQSHCDRAREEIEEAHAEMAKNVEENERVYALWLCAQEKGSDDVERAVLMLQWDDARKALQDKNRRPIEMIQS